MIQTPVELIIFDLDGTLVDSKEDLAAALTFALAPFGKGPIDGTTIKSLLGSGLASLLSMTLQSEDKAELAQAKERFDAYYQAHTADLTTCYPGVRETLQKLSGIQKAVCSNKTQRFTERVIAEMGLESYFDILQGAQPERFPLKPAPDGILAILEELAVSPSKALMVGDSTHDMEAAQAAGIRTCAVTYGYRPASILAAHHPDYMVDSFSALLTLV